MFWVPKINDFATSHRNTIIPWHQAATMPSYHGARTPEHHNTMVPRYQNIKILSRARPSPPNAAVSLVGGETLKSQFCYSAAEKPQCQETSLFTTL